MTRLQSLFYFFFLTRGRSILNELIVTMCAEDAEVLANVRLKRVILRVERYVASLPFFYFLLTKITLYLFEYAIPPFTLKILPFSRLSLEKRIQYMEEWQKSRLFLKRILFKMLCAICLSHLYSEKRLLISLGFGPSLQHRMGLTDDYRRKKIR